MRLKNEGSIYKLTWKNMAKQKTSRKRKTRKNTDMNGESTGLY